MSIKSKFDGPIPGQSLTSAKGASVDEKPPKYVELDKAMDSVFRNITHPKNASKITQLLKAGATVESIANSITFAGYAKGNWNPDLSMLMQRPVAYSIAALAERQGIKDVKFLNPDKETGKFMEMIDRIKPVSQEFEMPQQPTSIEAEGEEIQTDTMQPRFSNGILGADNIRDEMKQSLDPQGAEVRGLIDSAQRRLRVEPDNEKAKSVLEDVKQTYGLSDEELKKLGTREE